MRLLFLVFVILCCFYNGAYGKDTLGIDMKLKALNKPGLKTIKSEDGDIIDCVDINKQHAFDHPALRNHKIQMKPSVELVSKTTIDSNSSSSKPIQTWSKSGKCPKGTIPVRRVSGEDIRRASSPSRFGKKTHHRYRALDKALHHKANLTAENAPTGSDRSEALIVALGYNYIGASADINVWNPPNVQDNDYSSAQVWLFAGLSDSFESIEAGWSVNPPLFGDTLTRLITYWTKDGYDKTGCFNLLCSGFVQTTTKYALGAAIKPVSSPNSNQFQIHVGMFQDPNNGNWWLAVGGDWVGYWPMSLFGVLSHSAIAVQWGGEVYSHNVKKTPHTRTSMGSGDWASSLWQRASFLTNIRIKDYSGYIKYPEYLSEYTDESNCYSTKFYQTKDKSQSYFFFGGPGQNNGFP